MRRHHVYGLGLCFLVLAVARFLVGNDVIGHWVVNR